MSAYTSTPHGGPTGQRLAALILRERGLTLLGLIFLAATLPTLFAMAVDERMIGGVSVWAKPFKFQFSGGLHLVTVALAMLAVAPQARAGRLARVGVAAVAISTAFEVLYISLQGARGLPSHFAASALGQAMYGLMGLAATALVLGTAALAIPVLTRPAPGVPDALRYGLGLGLLVSGVFGLASGWAISLSHGPIVGVATGSGLPLFGWSRTAGDLRVGHFIALHAAQGLPLLGLLLRDRAPAFARTALIAAAALWSALALGAMLHALAGIPAFPMP